MVSQGLVSQQLIKAAKSRDMAGCQEALQQGADVFATDQAKSCVPKQTVQTSPRSLFHFQRKRHKWMQIMSVVPLLFSLGNCVRASTLRAKTSSVTSAMLPDLRPNSGQFGYTALHWAANHGLLDLCKLLREKGADAQLQRQQRIEKLVTGPFRIFEDTINVEFFGFAMDLQFCRLSHELVVRIASSLGSSPFSILHASKM